MSAALAPARQLELLLAQAEIHRTDGALQWQEWSCLGVEQGPPLVLLHGGFGSWNHWFLNIPALRQSRRVLSLDLPGLGESGDIDRAALPKEFATIVRPGLQSLLGDSAQCDLAAFSFGAMVAAEMALHLGQRCRRFTAIGAAGCGDLHVQVALQTPPGAEVVWDKAQEIHRANLQALMFHNPAAIDEVAIYLHSINLARHRFNSRALSLRNDFLQALPLIPAQLVGVWGAFDATAGGAAAIAQRRQHFVGAQAAAEFHVLPDVGHWAMYEAPRAINKILLG